MPTCPVVAAVLERACGANLQAMLGATMTPLVVVRRGNKYATVSVTARWMDVHLPIEKAKEPNAS